jgi:hypothetical protein
VKPSPISIAAVTATGVPKPAAPLEERPEREGDEQQLQSPVRRDAGNRVAQDIELPRPLGEPVKEDHVQDNPADRQQPEGGTVGRRRAGHGCGHSEADDRHDQRHSEAEERSDVRLQVQQADTTQQHQDWQRSERRRPE